MGNATDHTHAPTYIVKISCLSWGAQIGEVSLQYWTHSILHAIQAVELILTACWISVSSARASRAYSTTSPWHALWE